jgi:hypothetical protein
VKTTTESSLARVVVGLKSKYRTVGSARKGWRLTVKADDLLVTRDYGVIVGLGGGTSFIYAEVDRRRRYKTTVIGRGDLRRRAFSGAGVFLNSGALDGHLSFGHSGSWSNSGIWQGPGYWAGRAGFYANPAGNLRTFDRVRVRVQIWLEVGEIGWGDVSAEMRVKGFRAHIDDD